jgi:hypothetical protein
VEVTRRGWRVDGLPSGLKLIKKPRSPLTTTGRLAAPSPRFGWRQRSDVRR